MSSSRDYKTNIEECKRIIDDEKIPLVYFVNQHTKLDKLFRSENTNVTDLLAQLANIDQDLVATIGIELGSDTSIVLIRKKLQKRIEQLSDFKNIQEQWLIYLSAMQQPPSYQIMKDQLDNLIRIENSLIKIKKTFERPPFTDPLHHQTINEALNKKLVDFVEKLLPKIKGLETSLISVRKKLNEAQPPKPTIKKQQTFSSAKPRNEDPFKWWGAVIGFLLPLIGLAFCFAYPPAGISITLGNLYAIGPISALLGASIGAFMDNACCLPSLPRPTRKINTAGGGSAHPTLSAMAASTAQGKQEVQSDIESKRQPLSRDVSSASLAPAPTDATRPQPRIR